MTEAKRKIVVVDHDPEMGELVEAMLESDGYDVEWFLANGDTVEQVVEKHPDLVIVDLASRESHAYFSLLDQLRADERTAHIPVLVMTPSDTMAEEAATNYNVRGALVNPFDLNELFAQVREALASPRPHASRGPAPSDTLLAQAEFILALHSREAIYAWTRRLKERQPWRDRHDLGVRQLVDSVPILVEALTLGIRSERPAQFLQQHPEVLARASQHALLRKAQGIPLSDLVREYTLLRSEIWAMYQRYLPQQAAVSDVLRLAEILNVSLDRLIEITVSAYLVTTPQATA